MLYIPAEDQFTRGNEVIYESFCRHCADSTERAECPKGCVLFALLIKNMQEGATRAITSERQNVSSFFQKLIVHSRVLVALRRHSLSLGVVVSLEVATILTYDTYMSTLKQCIVQMKRTAPQ